ncbi:centrosomal protein CCDC61 isoform 3-T3 [Xenentodon cancila]
MLTWSFYATEKQELSVVHVATSSRLLSLPKDISYWSILWSLTGYTTLYRCHMRGSLIQLPCRRRSEPSGLSSAPSPLMESINLQMWKYSGYEQSMLLAVVKEEKEAMARALDGLQMTERVSTPGQDWRTRDVVRMLEEQLVKERAKSQRSTSKRCQEQRLLMEQLDELRASECALRIRVKSLTSELASLRRGLDDLSVRVTPVSGHTRSRVDGEVYRSLSCERRSGYGTGRARSGSRERTEDRQHWPMERGRRADSSGPRAYIPRPSPSPTGSRVPRFDPTAYIQDKQRRQKEAEVKKQRKVRRDMLTSPIIPERGRSRSRDAYPQMARSGSRGRSLSVERRGSRNSSESSLVDMEEMAQSLFRGRKQTYNGPNESRGGLLTRKPLSSTPTHRSKDKESTTDRSAELSEIDARLQALQEYMRDLDTGH